MRLPLVDCTSSDRSSLTAYTLLANAYVDLGTYGYVTPYVGAGIGGSYVKWKNLRNVACADDGSFCDDQVTHGGKGNWRFTYALMAGASIDVTCNVKADVGYRYLHIDGGNMFGYAEMAARAATRVSASTKPASAPAISSAAAPRRATNRRRKSRCSSRLQVSPISLHQKPPQQGGFSYCGPTALRQNMFPPRHFDLDYDAPDPYTRRRDTSPQRRAFYLKG